MFSIKKDLSPKLSDLAVTLTFDFDQQWNQHEQFAEGPEGCWMTEAEDFK